MPRQTQLATLIKPSCQEQLRQLAPGLFQIKDTTGSWHDILPQDIQLLINAIDGGASWQQVIFDYATSKQSSWLEQMLLSPSRALFLDLVEIKNSDTVLDLGSGWGQLTRALAQRAGHVVSVEANIDRLRVNHSIANQEQLNNISFLQADGLNLPFSESTFDSILLCGVFEWLAEEKDTPLFETQVKALESFYSLLKPNGRIIIAIENRVGLKYLLGERDDHSRVSGTSCLPFSEAAAEFEERTCQELRARTYSREEYQSLLSNAGFSTTNFFLAFPDYKLPQLLIPASQPEVVNYITSNIKFPDEHDGCDGSPSKFNQTLDIAYRSLVNTDAINDLAPSFIIESIRS